MFQCSYLLPLNYLFNISGMTVFPCNVPCPWRNKIFKFDRNGSPTVLGLVFGSDGQSITFNGQDSKCYQITERFLILRYVNVYTLYVPKCCG